MGKNPAFQFYPNDWRADLDDCPLEIEGAWIRICCRLWFSETPGRMTKSLDEWSRILRKNPSNSLKILRILIDSHVASGDILDNQITIISRRMERDIYLSKIRAKCGILGGNPIFKEGKKNPYYKDKKDNQTQSFLDNQKDNQKITPSSSSSLNNKEKKYIKKRKILSDDEWKGEILKLHPWLNWDMLNKEMDTWLLNNPHRQKTRKFITNWIMKKIKDKPMENPKKGSSIQPKANAPEWLGEAIKKGWK